MKHFLLFFSITFLSSCGIHSAKKIQKHISCPAETIHLSEHQNDTLKMSYIGAGGFLISQNNSRILLDPYFSNLGMLCNRLRVDSAAVDNFFAQNFRTGKDEAGEIKAILIAHSHYDHLADVPIVFNEKCHRDSTKIYGGKTTHHILKGAKISSEIIPFSKFNSFIYSADSSFRFIGIKSEHAPHLGKHKLLSDGKLCSDLAEFPTNKKKMPEGENFNFLIDFLDSDGNVSFRIFSNAGAGANAPVGFPSKKQLGNIPVDILLTCGASYSLVENYPDSLISYLKPKQIIVNHWENFFVPMRKLLKKPRTVPMTNIKKLTRKLEKLNADFILPRNYSQITFVK